MFDHEKLKIWQRAMALAIAMREALNTRRPGSPATSALKSQLLRACSAIAANIAECAGHSTGPQSARFMDFAIATISETQSHVTEAAAAGLLNAQKAAEFLKALRELRAMSCAFKRWLLRPPR